MDDQKNSQFDKDIPMEITQVEEETKHIEVPKQQTIEFSLEDFKSVLPTPMFESLSRIRDYLAQGEMQAAVDTLNSIRRDLIASKAYSHSLPVNLYTEEIIRQVKAKSTQHCEASDQAREMKRIVKSFLNRASPGQDYLTEHVSRRQLHDWEKTGKILHRSKDLCLAASAVTAVFVLNPGYKMPVLVTNSNAGIVKEFMELSLDLGGFPLLELSFDAVEPTVLQELKYLVTVQNELTATNQNSYKCSLLHILADCSSLTPLQQSRLQTYLAETSFQRVNLLQPDYQSFTPLSRAFTKANTDFIMAVLQCPNVSSFDLWSLLYFDRRWNENPLTNFFAPPALDMLSKKRTTEENPQIRVLAALRTFLGTRTDLSQLLDTISAQNLKLLQGFDQYSTREHKLAAFQMLSNVWPDDTKLWQHLPLFYECQKWLCNAVVSDAVKEMAPVDQFMIALFGSAIHEFGFSIIQLAAYSTSEELSSFMEACPGLGYLMRHEITPVFKSQKSLVNLKKIELTTALFENDQTCFLSAFKLAALFQPDATEVHSFLSQIVEPAKTMAFCHFELLISIGENLGDQNQKFKDLYAQQPWLQLESNSLIKKQDFEALIERMASVLIRNQNSKLFGSFLLSIRHLLDKNDRLVNALFYQCRIHLNATCFVPLFAICSNTCIVKLDQYENHLPIEDRFIAEKYTKPHLKDKKTTQDEVSTCVNIWNKLSQYKAELRSNRLPTLRINEFFEAVEDGPLAEDLINFIVENGLIRTHFPEIDFATYNVIRRASSLQEFNSQAVQSIAQRFHFCKEVFKNCSAGMIDKFFAKEYEFRLRHKFTSGLLPLYLINAVVSTTIDAEKDAQKDSKYREGNRRKNTLLLPTTLENAIQFPQQAQLLRDSQTDSQIAARLAERLGVDIADFVSASAEAIVKLDKQAGLKYGFDEIGAQSGPIKRDSQLPTKTPTKIAQIKIQVMTKQARDGPIQQEIYELKYQTIFAILKSFIEQADDQQLDVFLHWLHAREFSNKVHRNLMEIVQSYKYQKRDWNYKPKPLFAIRTHRLKLQIMQRYFKSDETKALTQKLRDLYDFYQQHDDSKQNEAEFQKIFATYANQFKFFFLFRPMEYYLRNLFIESQGNKFVQDEIVAIIKDFYGIIGKEFGSLLKLDFAVLKIKELIKEDEMNGSENQDNFEDRHKLSNLLLESDWSFIHELVYKQITHDYLKLTVFNSQFLQSWLPFDSYLVNAFIESFDESIEAMLIDFNEKQTIEDASMVAYMFSLMSPAQIETCLACKTSSFQLGFGTMSLTSLLERNDLPKATISKILEKASQGNLAFFLIKSRVGFSPYCLTDMEEQSTAAKILHVVILSRLLQKGRLEVADLPVQLVADCAVDHLVRAIICSPCNQDESQEKYAEFVKFLIGKLQDPVRLLARYDRAFTFLCTHLGNNSLLFDLINDWVVQEYSGTSVLEFELNHQNRVDEKETILGQLLHQSRNDIIYKMRQYASPETWAQVVQETTQVFSNSSARPWKLHKEENGRENFQMQNSYYRMQRYVEEEKKEDLDITEEKNEMTPFFVALNMNQFELASILAPQEFKQLATAEYCLLYEKLKSGINPLLLDSESNKTKIKQMQEWLDSSQAGGSSLQFAAVQLITLLPKLAVMFIKAGEASQDAILASELDSLERSGDEVSANYVQNFFEHNPIRSLLLTEAARDASVCKFLLNAGVFTDVHQVISQVFAMKLHSSHAEAQAYLVDLLMVNGMEAIPELAAGLEMAKTLNRAPRDFAYLQGVQNQLDYLVTDFSVDKAFIHLLTDHTNMLLSFDHQHKDQIDDCICIRLMPTKNDLKNFGKSLVTKMRREFATRTEQIGAASGATATLIKLMLEELNQLSLCHVFTRKAQQEETSKSYMISSLEGLLKQKATLGFWDERYEVYSKDESALLGLVCKVIGEIVPQIGIHDTTACASIWFGLLAYYKYDRTKVNLDQLMRMMFDLRFETMASAQTVVRQILDFVGPELQLHLNSRLSQESEKIDGIQELIQLTKELTDEESKFASFQFWLLFQLYPAQKKEHFNYIMNQVIKDNDTIANLLQKALNISSSLASHENANTEMVESLSNHIIAKAQSCSEVVKLDLAPCSIQTFSQLASICDKLIKLQFLFEAKNKDAKRTICLMNDFTQMFEVQEEESKEEEARLTLVLDTKVLIDEATFASVIDGQRQVEVNTQALQLINKIKSEMTALADKNISHIAFKEVSFEGPCPIDLLSTFQQGKFNVLQIVKTLAHIDLTAGLVSTIFEADDLSYFKECELKLSFSQNVNKNNQFLLTLGEYQDRPKTLTAIINGDSLGVCLESYLPFVSRALSTAFRSYFTKMIPGMSDVPVSVDIHGLDKRLAKHMEEIAKSLGDKTLLNLFEQLKGHFAECEAVRNLQYTFEELRNRVCGLQSQFKAVSKAKVKYNQIKGVVVQLQADNDSLDFDTIDEDLLEKGTDEFNQFACLFPKVPTPFEGKLVPKNYLSKIAQLTVKFR